MGVAKHEAEADTLTSRGSPSLVRKPAPAVGGAYTHFNITNLYLYLDQGPASLEVVLKHLWVCEEGGVRECKCDYIYILCETVSLLIAQSWLLETTVSVEGG